MALTEQDARALQIDEIDSIGPQDPMEGSLAHRLAGNETTAALSFAGQGVRWLDELAAVIDERPWAGPIVTAATAHLQEVAAEPVWRSSGVLHSGIDLSAWAADPAAAPSSPYLASIAVSMPAICLVQSLRLSHRAYVLETGRITLEGAASDLLTNPHTRRAFLGLAT